MLKNIYHRQWLFLLAAIVLIMQSFALWHDAVHPFHTASAQCEKMASISHTPSALITCLLPPAFITQFSEIHSSQIISIPQSVTHLQNIRAPPVFS